MGLLQPHGRHGRRHGQAHLIAFESAVAAFRTLDEADLRGKRVLLRVDLNVPMDDGKVSDLTRLERAAPTITEIADRGGKAILLSHFGRPKGRPSADSLNPVADPLARAPH